MGGMRTQLTDLALSYLKASLRRAKPFSQVNKEEYWLKTDRDFASVLDEIDDQMRRDSIVIKVNPIAAKPAT